MIPTLLSPNVRIPPVRPRSIARERLVRALDACVRECRITLLTAPAGYGKSTLLAQWAHHTDVPVAWLTVEPDMNDPEQLLRGLVAAWDEAEPGIRESPVGLIAGSMSPDLATVTAAFIEVTSERQEPLIFVLDDSHHLTDARALDTLAVLIEHLPATCRLILAGRGAPALSLARHRAHGDLAEIGAADLRLRDDELRAFLATRLANPLPEDRVASLQERLEGWFAGVQLVCHAIERRPESSSEVPISGRHRFVAAYLREDVLATLDDERRQFLLRTSILDRLCAGLCDATTERRDSQTMLEALEREGFFLDALDDGLEWFRYHPLFREVLLEELRRADPGEEQALHRRAARWYREQGMPDQALAHAVAGNDVDLTIRLCEDYSVIKMESGELAVVGRWLDAIPDNWFADYPVLSLMRVAYLLYSGAFEGSARLLDEVEERMQRSQGWDTPVQLGKVATVRCAIACFQNDLARAESFAAAALQALPEDESFYRTSIHHALGDTYSRNADWINAKKSLLAALSIIHEPSYRIRSVHIFGALADLELRQGHLEQASSYWSRALAVIPEPEMWGRLPIPVTGWVFIRMGEILYERNRCEESRAHVQRGLDLARLGGDVRSLIAGNLLSARLNLTEGQIAQGAVDLDRARSLLEQAQFAEWARRSDRLQLEYWLTQDRLRSAVEWADAMPEDGIRDTQPEPEIDQLTLARVLIMKGYQQDRDRALRILRGVVERSAGEGRLGIQIDALALQSLALWNTGDRSGALTTLERALRLAEPERYIRLFADLGMPIARLLQEARNRQVVPEYCQAVLAAISPDLGLGPGGSASLPEPLSERELEVLRLIAAGLTNREIGELLFISAETVKKHTGNIYAKLGVGNRTEAVSRGRALGQID